MVGFSDCWKEMGDTMVPNSPLVTNNKHWHTTGTLLALALLVGDNLHPVSLLVIYAPL